MSAAAGALELWCSATYIVFINKENKNGKTISNTFLQ
jgi:hypothetical protein